MYIAQITFVDWSNQFRISIRLQLYVGPIMYHNLKNSQMADLISLRHLYY